VDDETPSAFMSATLKWLGLLEYLIAFRALAKFINRGMSVMT